MIRCPHCLGELPAGSARCAACGRSLPSSKARQRPQPRSYRRIRDPNRWKVGVSAGAILLSVAVGATVRMLGRQADRYAEQEERESALDERSVRVNPGEVHVEEVVFTEAEGYTLSVMPYDAPCRAAFVRVGAADERPTREAVLRALKAEAVDVDKKRNRVLEGRTGTGRYAWAVWHDADAPVRILAIFLDSRGRR